MSLAIPAPNALILPSLAAALSSLACDPRLICSLVTGPVSATLTPGPGCDCGFRSQCTGSPSGFGRYQPAASKALGSAVELTSIALP